MNLPLYIARRLYRQNDLQQKVSRPAIRIAMAGVAIGLAVMIVSVCIVFGFKHTIRDKVIGFGGHLQVSNFSTLHGSGMKPVNIDPAMMKKLSAIEGVSHVQRYTWTQGILKTDNDFLGVVFTGVGEEFDSTFMHKHLVTGSVPRFSSTASRGNILVSKSMAEALKLKAGDRVYAYFMNDNNVKVRRFTVGGIYQTNLTFYDKNTCFIDLYTATKLNGWEDDQVTGAQLSVSDFDRLDEVENRLVEQVNRHTDSYGEPFSSQNIKEANPQIFSWLELLDLNVWIILALMLCVAGFTMVSGLLIIILERTAMIGVLKALGARNGMVRKTFIWFAVFIIGRGMAIGNIVGFGLVLLQKYTGMVKLDAATYYVETVPVEIDLPLLLALNVATLLLSVFVLIAPSYLVSHIHPAKSMKYE